ncbi:MAG: cob(I)yrinic acid a,c-diamide adenosyltransferase [Nanoarchaeota archaeon]
MKAQKNNRKGLSHIYLDEEQEKQSNVALGILCRAIGHNLKITYINSKRNAFQIIDSFSAYLLKNINFFDYDSFCLDYIKNNDLIIFDNFSFSHLSINQIDEILINKKKQTEIIFVFKKQKEFNAIKKKFDLISQYKYTKNPKGRNNITNIYGNGKGKSTYVFGRAIKELINNNIKNNNQTLQIIYFDKGGDFYGEKYFFTKLNKAKLNFNYKSYGLSRIENNEFRYTNIPQDIKEAQKGLLEIKNSFQIDLLIADELNTTIDSKLLKEEEIIKVLKSIKNQILISGRTTNKKIIEIAKYKIEVIGQKHYFDKNYGCKKGIDL